VGGAGEEAAAGDVAAGDAACKSCSSSYGRSCSMSCGWS
jgi:hypothetical protein